MRCHVRSSASPAPSSPPNVRSAQQRAPLGAARRRQRPDPPAAGRGNRRADARSRPGASRRRRHRSAPVRRRCARRAPRSRSRARGVRDRDRPRGGRDGRAGTRDLPRDCRSSPSRSAEGCISTSPICRRRSLTKETASRTRYGSSRRAGSRASLGAATLTTNSSHHQAPSDLPALLEAVGRTSDGVIEAVEGPGLHRRGRLASRDDGRRDRTAACSPPSSPPRTTAPSPTPSGHEKWPIASYTRLGPGSTRQCRPRKPDAGNPLEVRTSASDDGSGVRNLNDPPAGDARRNGARRWDQNEEAGAPASSLFRDARRFRLRGLTFVACGPFLPSLISNSTCWPSARERKPSPAMPVK